jgi:hypothetical protein
MGVLSSWSHVKILFVAFISIVIIHSVVSAAYTGTRYGKRESTESIGRMFPRSGVRNIQARSSGTRFYPGTRFGGKRSYWQPAAPILSEMIQNSDSPSSNLPYDCVYIPFVGVRCSRAEENYWNNNNNDEETNDGFESDGSASPSGSAGVVGGSS